MAMKATITVAKKELGPSGSNDRGSWQVYRIFDGNEVRYTTFKQALYSVAEEGKKFHIEYEETDKGNNLTAIEPALEKEETPPLGTGEYVSGQSAPTDARRFIAQSSWNQGVSIAMAEYAVHAEQIDHDQLKALVDSWVSHVWLDQLRKARLFEDEDIPF